MVFNANGGSPEIQVVEVDDHGRIPELPEVSYGSYVFIGWFTERTGGVEITTSTVFKKDSTVYAHWICPEPGTFTVKIVAGSNGSVHNCGEHEYPNGTPVKVSGNLLTIGED